MSKLSILSVGARRTKKIKSLSVQRVPCGALKYPSNNNITLLKKKCRTFVIFDNGSSKSTQLSGGGKYSTQIQNCIAELS